ncbi:MAG TPA: hypothetical protein VK763_05655 [Terriglobales bacterium]|jgi:hypothetical protein|nr:hypothetical protein [Terriglobales bacterium]
MIAVSWFCKRTVFFMGLLLLAGSFMTVGSQQTPDPHQVPVMDGEAGPCSVSFTVTDEKGTPVYDARIRVKMRYGFAGVKHLDLEAATNVDGKTQIKGLPQKVKDGILYFRGTQGKREGSATYDPAKNCDGINSSIVLREDKPATD